MGNGEWLLGRNRDAETQGMVMGNVNGDWDGELRAWKEVGERDGDRS